MNIKEIIHKDIPSFTGIVVTEGYIPIETVNNNGVTLAWIFNTTRAKKLKKILIAGGKKYKGSYFIADIDEIISVEELIERPEYKNSILLQNKIFGNWISDRQNGKIIDNVLSERKAIIFKNSTKIKNFSIKKFKFFSNPITYIYGNNTENNKFYGETLHLTNIGKVAKANIKLNGLTLIAGVNNTGKSTIGKLLFSIVKAISRFEQDLNEDKIHNIFRKIEKLYFLIRRTRNISEESDIREQFYPRKFLSQIQFLIDENDNKQASLFAINIKDKINNIFEYKYKLIHQLPSEVKTSAINILNDIRASILKKESKSEQIKRALNKALFSEFYSEITPKGTSKNSTVEYYSGKNKILNFEVSKNEITSISLEDDLIFDDVIFIESPLLLQMFDIIRSAETLFDNENKERYGGAPKLPLHIKDLIVKIENAKYFSNSFFETRIEQIDILKKISKIINGGYTFEEKDRDFVFSQKVGTRQSVKLKPTNTASGVKSFGIIQLLIQANVLDDRTLLIIDEPENHLHPEWQVKYAEIIVELIKNDISVIISSHSPYMIQALKYYSEKEKIENKSNFYLAEFIGDNLYTNIKEVTNDLNKIFSKLAKPLKELVWE